MSDSDEGKGRDTEGVQFVAGAYVALMALLVGGGAVLTLLDRKRGSGRGR